MSSDAASEDAQTFAELGLSEPLLQAIAVSGYTKPTPIQAKAIPIVLQGRDVLGIAQTGTGKTASFTLPMIEILSAGRAKARMPRTLILEPTRELAAQVAESFDKYGKNHKLTKALLIGGVSFGDQEALLNQGVDVLIATPGRLLDHFERGKLLLSGVQVMVVDEADRMLDMGFIPDIERIFKLTPFTRQTLFFSATMPAEITRLTEQFLSNPKRIEASRPATAAAAIDQRVVAIPGGDPRTRRAALRAVMRHGEVKNGIVFCNRKTDVDVVAQSLRRHGFNAAPLHGDLDQRQRMQTLDRFKTGDLQFLIASDVAARGLDIPAVSHVFNYEPPRHAEDYVHRIGRTGRAGLSGQSYTLVAPQDSRSIDAIEKLMGRKIEAADAIAEMPESAMGDARDSGGRGRRAEELKEERRHRHDRGRDKSRYKQRDPNRPTADTAPLPAADEPRRERSEPHTDRGERRHDRGEERRERSAPRADRGERAEGRGDRGGRGERSRERERAEKPGAQVQGFGEDLPAFLKTKS